MTTLSILGAFFYQNKIISKNDLFKQKLNLYLMSFGFYFYFILFHQPWFYIGHLIIFGNLFSKDLLVFDLILIRCYKIF